MHYHKTTSFLRNSGITLNRKRKDISVENLIAPLSVENMVQVKILMREEVRLIVAPTWYRKTHSSRTKRK